MIAYVDIYVYILLWKDNLLNLSFKYYKVYTNIQRE